MSQEVYQRLRVSTRFDPVIRRKMMTNPAQFLQNYDLTEEERNSIILPRFDWLIENKLAAMPYPQTRDAYLLLQSMGIRCILNLTEYLDEVPVALSIQVTHIPVPDLTAPTLEQLVNAVRLIESCLADETPLAVHCVAGLGRTGTVLAAYLIAQGMTAEAAIRDIREWRPGSIETEDQEAILYEYEKILAERKPV